MYKVMESTKLMHFSLYLISHVSSHLLVACTNGILYDLALLFYTKVFFV